MYQLIALYNHPGDPSTFDKHYDTVHASLVRKLPGLEALTVARPVPGPDGAAPAYHLVATLDFADASALQNALGSEEGQAAVADLENFAQGGVTMLTAEAQRF